jgi:hypothetical protein
MPGGIDKLRALSVPEVVAEARKAVIDAGGKQRQGADSQCAAQVLREYQ